MSFIQPDAVLAVVVHPQRAVESEIGKLVLGLDGVHQELARSNIKPEDVTRIIYTEGQPTDELDNELAIVEFAREIPKDELLSSEFWTFPFVEAEFNGLKYHRFDVPDFDDGAAEPADVVRVVESPDDSSPAAVFFPDPQTLVLTSERQLRQLLSDPPQASPISKAFQDIDFDHDLILTVAPGDDPKHGTEVLKAFAEEYGFDGLPGVAEAGQTLTSAVITVDLSSRQLVEFTATASSDEAAGRLFEAANEGLSTLHGLAAIVPEKLPNGDSNPSHAMVQGFVDGLSVRRNGTRVIVGSRAPDGFTAFLSDNLDDIVASINPSDTFLADEMRPEDIGAGDFADFRPLTDDVSGVSVDFPGRPKEEVARMDSLDGPIDVSTWTAEYRGNTFVFSVIVYPEDTIQKTTPGKLLSEFRNGRVDEPTGTLLDVRKNRLDGWPAENFDFAHPENGPDAFATARVALKGNRMFHIEVIGRAPEDIVDFYFASLVLEPDAVAKEDDNVKVVAEPPAQPDPKIKRPTREPVPEARAYAQAMVLVRDVYQRALDGARTPESKVALATKLYADSSRIDDPAQRYVMLDLARLYSIEGNDAALVIRIVDRMGSTFEIDVVEIKGRSLTSLLIARITPDDRMLVVNELINVSEVAVKKDDFASAVELQDHALALARKARATEVVKEIALTLGQTRTLQASREALQPLFDTLKENPDAPDANLAVGRYRCFSQGAFEIGLPMLARGNDVRLKTLATRDLKESKQTADRLAVADGWWDLAAELDGIELRHVRSRAADWYRLALPGLSGLERRKAQQRLSEVLRSELP